GFFGALPHLDIALLVQAALQQVASGSGSGAVLSLEDAGEMGNRTEAMAPVVGGEVGERTGVEQRRRRGWAPGDQGIAAGPRRQELRRLVFDDRFYGANEIIKRDLSVAIAVGAAGLEPIDDRGGEAPHDDAVALLLALPRRLDLA